jgi:hypothetical protein
VIGHDEALEAAAQRGPHRRASAGLWPPAGGPW